MSVARRASRHGDAWQARSYEQNLQLWKYVEVCLMATIPISAPGLRVTPSLLQGLGLFNIWLAPNAQRALERGQMLQWPRARHWLRVPRRGVPEPRTPALRASAGTPRTCA